MKNKCCEDDCKCDCCKDGCKCGCGKDECEMSSFKKMCKMHCHGKMHGHGHGDSGGGAVYCMGMIGAAIYFIGHAATFWMGVLGLLKAITWPVFMVLEAFKALLG